MMTVVAKVAKNYDLCRCGNKKTKNAPRCWECRHTSPKDDYKRFLSFVEVDRATGCHLWKGYLWNGGYGCFRVTEGEKQFSRRAHKWAYEYKYGPVPEGLVLDHYFCDNKSCVNPDHVRPVTNRENSLRCESGISAINSRKTHCCHGHPFSPENTIIRTRNGGWTVRSCRACIVDISKRYREKCKAMKELS